MTTTNMNYWVIIGIGEKESILGPYESEEVQEKNFEEAKKEVGDVGVVFKHKSLETDPEKAFKEFKDSGVDEKKPPIPISQRDKPGSLHAEETVISPASPASPTPTGKTGGMASWMPSIVAVVIAIAVSTGMLYLFNPASAELNTLASQIEENLNSKIASIESTVSQSNQRFEALLSTSANYVTQDALAGLASQQSVTDLSSQLSSQVDTKVAELNARMDALEVEAEEEAIAQTVIEDTVRWRFTDASFDFTVSKYHELVDIDVSSKTIDEEDYYNVTVTLEYLGEDEVNIAETLRLGNYFSLVLEPRGDALLDESYTNLYSESSPYTDWDADFRYRERDGVKTTSRVVFESYDPYELTLTEGDAFRIDLELELGYAR